MLRRIPRAGAVLAVLLTLLLGSDLVRQVVVTSAERIRTPDPTDLQAHIIRDHARRVRDGLPVYMEPDATFCPLLYTPLYYHACAAVMGFAGTGIAACRITSVLLLGIAVVAVTAFVARITRSALTTAAVPVAALAGYEGSGFFYDAARVDAASSLLVVLAVLAGAFATRPRGGVAVGVLLAVAFFAKQSTTAFAIPFLFALLLRGRRVAAAAAATYVPLVVAGVALATWASDGWFWRVCVLLPRDHPLPPERVVGQFGADWGERLRGFSVTAAAVAAALAWRRRRNAPAGDPSAPDRTLTFLLAAFGSLLVMTTLSHGREGGTVKTLMPACILLAGIVPIGLWSAVRAARGRAADLATIAAAGLFAFLVVEGRFDREDAVLTPEVLRGWDALAELVETRAESGEVWTALSGYPELPGQPMRPGELALNDYLRAGRNELPPAVEEAVASRRFAAIVLQERLSRVGGDRRTAFARLVQEHYRASKRVNVRAGILRKKLIAGIYVPSEPRASVSRRIRASASRNATSTMRRSGELAAANARHSRTATRAASPGG